MGARAPACIALLAIVAGPAEAATSLRADLALAFDPAIWRESPSTPPTLLALDCIAPDCGTSASVVFLPGPNLPPRPGAGFTPGALGATALILRADTIAPGARLRAVESYQPIRFGPFDGYRASFTIENRDLERRDFRHVVIEAGAEPLQVTFVADRIDATADFNFERLLAGLVLSGIPTP